MAISCFACKQGFETDQIVCHPCKTPLHERVELLFHERCARAYVCPYCHFDVALSLKDKYLLVTLTSMGLAATYGLSRHADPNSQNGFSSGALATFLGTLPLFLPAPRKALMSVSFLVAAISFMVLSKQEPIELILTATGACLSMLTLFPTLRLASRIPPHELRFWPFYAVAMSAMGTLAAKADPFQLHTWEGMRGVEWTAKFLLSLAYSVGALTVLKFTR